MLTIHKFVIEISDRFAIPLQRGAKIIHVAAQRDKACFWVLRDPNSTDIELRKFRCFGTGHPIYEPIECLIFLGTAILHDGALVFHFFEET